MKICSYDGRYNIIGKKVRYYREQLGITQEQLAACMQINGVQLTQKAISRIESGERIVTDFELKAFAPVLKTTYEDLLITE